MTSNTVTIDGNAYTSEYQFDSNFDRLKGMVYPNQLTIAYGYNDLGYLEKEYNAADNYVYRKVTEMNAWGRITHAELTDNLLGGTYDFDQATGQMLSTQVSLSGTVKQHITYDDYDIFGNIKQQTNALTQTQERFVYDNLHRLTANTLSNPQGTAQHIDYRYNAVGNLTKKSDYANTYNYPAQGSVRPNAVSNVIKIGEVDETVFGYDNKGNLINGDGKTTTYNAMNKPLTISSNGSRLAFTYGADLARYKQTKTVNGVTTTLYYIDKLYQEERSSANDILNTTSYISDVAMVKTFEDKADEIAFNHVDRLGSATVVTNQAGTVVSERSFDPFGKPRKINGTRLEKPTLAALDTLVNGLLKAYDNRGFTGHEHLDEAELIHMNGRVYDYNLGRFMSVDPFVQAPGNSQSMNPYSYIMNNPLAGTDPTGYTTVWDSKNCGDPNQCMASLKRTLTKLGFEVQGGKFKIPSSGQTGSFKTADIGSSAKRKAGHSGPQGPMGVVVN